MATVDAVGGESLTDHSSRVVQVGVGIGGIIGTEKVLGRKTSLKFEIFLLFASGVFFITLHGFELCR